MALTKLAQATSLDDLLKISLQEWKMVEESDHQALRDRVGEVKANEWIRIATRRQPKLSNDYHPSGEVLTGAETAASIADRMGLGAVTVSGDREVADSGPINIQDNRIAHFERQEIGIGYEYDPQDFSPVFAFDPRTKSWSEKKTLAEMLAGGSKVITATDTDVVHHAEKGATPGAWLSQFNGTSAEIVSDTTLDIDGNLLTIIGVAKVDDNGGRMAVSFLDGGSLEIGIDSEGTDGTFVPRINAAATLGGASTQATTDAGGSLVVYRLQYDLDNDERSLWINGTPVVDDGGAGMTAMISDGHTIHIGSAGASAFMEGLHGPLFIYEEVGDRMGIVESILARQYGITITNDYYEPFRSKIIVSDPILPGTTVNPLIMFDSSKGVDLDGSNRILRIANMAPGQEDLYCIGDDELGLQLNNAIDPPAMVDGGINFSGEVLGLKLKSRLPLKTPKTIIIEGDLLNSATQQILFCQSSPDVYKLSYTSLYSTRRWSSQMQSNEDPWYLIGSTNARPDAGNNYCGVSWGADILNNQFFQNSYSLAEDNEVNQVSGLDGRNNAETLSSEYLFIGGIVREDNNFSVTNQLIDGVNIRKFIFIPEQLTAAQIKGIIEWMQRADNKYFS